MSLIKSSLLALAALQVFALTAHAQNSYEQVNLVSNSEDYRPQILEPHMLDAWGIALRPPGAGGHIWVNNAVSGTSDEFIGDVNGAPLHQDGLTSVPLDMPKFTDHGYAFTTGISYNAAKDVTGQPVEFPVSGPALDNTTHPPTPIPGGTSGACAFIFVTEDGCINAWRSATKPAMPTAPIIVDYSKTSKFPYGYNCVFSGCALTVNPANSPAYAAAGGNHLFATDFRNNAIQVFDNKWKDVTSSYHFQTPASVGHLHPFNILDLAGHLYVSYAEFNAEGDEGMEESDGSGLGHVVEYNEDGTLVKDFNDEGHLNAPWGMAIAPAGFGKLGGDLLVTNFGDGAIAAFDPATGNFIDFMRDSLGNPIEIDGIWGLTFGNGVSLGDSNSLYFTAGPNNEEDGIFGKLVCVAPLIDANAASPKAAVSIYFISLFTLLLIASAFKVVLNRPSS